jgi:hypothetical protein
MKRYLFIFLLAVSGLTSCKMGGSFNRQKYTHLKSIKETKHNQALIKIKSELTERLTKDEGPKDLQPVSHKVKEAMNRGDMFVIKIDKQVYILRDPEYDIIYQSLSGDLVAADEKDYSDIQRIEITVPEVEDAGHGKKIIYLRYVEEVEIISSEQIEEQGRYHEVKSPVQDESNDQQEDLNYTEPQYKKGYFVLPIRKDELRSAPNHPLHESSTVKKIRKGKIALMVLTLAILAFTLLSFVEWFFLLFVVAGIISLFLTLTVMASNFRRYKNECHDAGIKEKKEVKRWKRFTWVGLVLMSAPLLFLPLILPGIAIASQGRRKFQKL